MQFIVFTDLDGTLLHPTTYSFEEAKPSLELLRQRNIPLVLCSSKTRAEIEIYRRRLRNRHPFIPENGGGVFIPPGYFPFRVAGRLQNGYFLIRLGASYEQVRSVFISLRNKFGKTVKGFADMTVPEVARLTGLSLREAGLAKKREFDEPFIFFHEPDELFLNEIVKQGMQWTRGRIFHIFGYSDKGTAVSILKKLYENEYDTIRTIGIGDSFNDLPLLREVDSPVLVRKADGTHEPIVIDQNVIKTDGIGPTGWNEAILNLIGQ